MTWLPGQVARQEMAGGLAAPSGRFFCKGAAQDAEAAESTAAGRGEGDDAAASGVDTKQLQVWPYPCLQASPPRPRVSSSGPEVERLSAMHISAAVLSA